MRPGRPALGPRRQYPARFDPAVFDAIAAYAASHSISFNTALAMLALRGLEAEQQPIERAPSTAPAAASARFAVVAAYRDDALPAIARLHPAPCTCRSTAGLCLIHGDRLADALRREVGR